LISLDPYLLYVFCFFVGSIPSAFILARVFKGIDLRFVGSGSLGASNIGVQVGRLWMVPVILFDLLVKGMSPVLLAQTVLSSGLHDFSLAIAPLIVLVCHNWCCCLKFDGGRGILVLIGSLMLLAPEICATVLVTGLCVSLVTRNVPLTVLVGLMIMPFVALLWDAGLSVLVFTILAILVVLLKRILGNRGRRAKDISRMKLLVNRILFDRDITSRIEWINGRC